MPPPELREEELPYALRRAPGPMQEKAGSKSRRRTRRALLAVCITAAVVLLAVIAVDIWTRAPEIEEEGLIDQSGSAEKVGEVIATQAPAATPEPSQETQATPKPTEQPSTGRRPNTYTVLVVGEDVAGMNTDTIMVGTLDIDAGTLDVVSIPRDTLVNVPWNIKKVNTYYASAGGIEGLMDGLSELLGFRIDSYIIMNVYCFEQVIDAIGGVYFDVPVNMSWGDPTIGRSYNIAAGEQWLDGYNALGVVRFRKNTDGTGYPTGDIGRIETQQKFLKACAKQMLKLGNIPNLGKVTSIVTDNLDTNLSSGNMAFFAQEFLKLDGDSIRFHTMPYEAVYIKGGSYVSLQLDDWLKMLNQYINPYYSDITAGNLDVLTYSNGTFYATTGVLAGGYDSFYDYSNAG